MLARKACSACRTAIREGAAAATKTLVAGTDIDTSGLTVWDEIGTDGVAEGSDCCGKLGGERGFKILVTDCHNDLGGGLTDDGAPNELVCGDPAAGGWGLRVLQSTPSTGTSATICET